MYEFFCFLIKFEHKIYRFENTLCQNKRHRFYMYDTFVRCYLILVMFSRNIHQRTCNKKHIYSQPHLVLYVGTIPCNANKTTCSRHRVTVALWPKRHRSAPDLWPLATNSPDLNPVDYEVGAILFNVDLLLNVANLKWLLGIVTTCAPSPPSKR